MADSTHPRSAGESADDRGIGGASDVWVRRIVLALGLIVAILIAYSVLSALLPRWWAQRVAAQVDGRMSVGIFWGLFYGFVFSFAPLLVLWQARRSMRWLFRIAVVVAAVLLATPNWLTLACRVGISKAAEDGWLVLVVRAPGFQWSSLIGAIVGVVAAVTLVAVLASWRRRKHEVDDLKGRLAERAGPTTAERTNTNEHHREEPHA